MNHPGDDADEDVDEGAAEAGRHRHHLARRGLGSHHRLRLVAVMLWAGFLGAVPMLLSVWLLLPQASALQLGMAELSIGFLLCWLAAMIPAAIGAVLAAPLAASLPRGHDMAGGLGHD